MEVSTDTERPDEAFIIAELAACAASPHYFINNYCYVEDVQRNSVDEFTDDDDMTKGGTGIWVPFHLWKPQHKPLRLLHLNRLIIWLKARQLGLTWLSLAYALWMLIFVTGSVVMLFSRRDTEALELLRRLKGMFLRLPEWMWPENSVDKKGRLTGSSGHKWTLGDGGVAMAFPTTAGDSYTANLVIVDEADLVPNLDQLMASVKPTIDNGGKLLLVSRVDKSKPGSAFKNIFRGAVAGLNGYSWCFLPWYAHPRRTNRWYAEQRRESMARTLSLDHVREAYPATAEEALAARSLDKRFPEPAMVEARVYQHLPDLAEGNSSKLYARWEEGAALPVTEIVKSEGYTVVREYTPTVGNLGKRQVSVRCPAIPGLLVYRLPSVGLKSVIGCDPAQGLISSNDSAIVVVDTASGEELASVAGKFAPKVLARYAAELCDWYSATPGSHSQVMVERNNHGHAFLQWWESNRRAEDYRAQLANGLDGHKGWNQTGTSKEVMWHRASQRVSDRRCILHTHRIYSQILDIEAATLEAPEGFLDDLAVAWGLALAGADLAPRRDFRVRQYG